jgi:hypothetical protein
MDPHLNRLDRESAPSIGAARGVGSGWYVEEIENFQLQRVELGLEDLDEHSLGDEVVTLDTGEDLEDPRGARGRAVPQLGVSGMPASSSSFIVVRISRSMSASVIMARKWQSMSASIRCACSR